MNTTTKPDFFKITSFFWGEANKKRFLFSASFGRWVSGRNKTCRIDKKVWTACPQVIPLVIASGEKTMRFVLVSLRLVGKTTPNPQKKIWVFCLIKMKMDGFLVPRTCSQSLIFQEHLWNVSLSEVTLRNRTYHLDTVYKGYTSKNATTASLSRALGWQ